MSSSNFTPDYVCRVAEYWIIRGWINAQKQREHEEAQTYERHIEAAREAEWWETRVADIVKDLNDDHTRGE